MAYLGNGVEPRFQLAPCHRQQLKRRGTTGGWLNLTWQRPISAIEETDLPAVLRGFEKRGVNDTGLGRCAKRVFRYAIAIAIAIEPWWRGGDSTSAAGGGSVQRKDEMHREYRLRGMIIKGHLTLNAFCI